MVIAKVNGASVRLIVAIGIVGMVDAHAETVLKSFVVKIFKFAEAGNLKGNLYGIFQKGLV